jgi:ketosteroid isomerase-like protein
LTPAKGRAIICASGGMKKRVGKLHWKHCTYKKYQMKYNQIFIPFVCLTILFTSCQQAGNANQPMSKGEMLKIVKDNDFKFSTGIRTKNALLLAEIYTDSAQYVQNHRRILMGKDSIRKDWENFIALKSNPVDLILIPHEVRGDREIIYETGEGYTLLADSSKWEFNYVNVWRLQNDGSFKLDIDIYNELK